MASATRSGSASARSASALAWWNCAACKTNGLSCASAAAFLYSSAASASDPPDSRDSARIMLGGWPS